MAASRVGGYHVRPPTTWPGRTPTSRSGEMNLARGDPRCASPPGSTTSKRRHSRHVFLPTQVPQPGKEPLRQRRWEVGTPGRSPEEPQETGDHGLTLTRKPSSSTEQGGGPGPRPTRTTSLGCAGVTQESSQTPPTALYKAKHSPIPALGSLRLKGVAASHAPAAARPP